MCERERSDLTTNRKHRSCTGNNRTFPSVTIEELLTCISADKFELTYLLRLDLDWGGARGDGGDEVTPEGLNSSSSSSIPPTLPSGELRFLFGEGPIDEEAERFRALRSSAFFLRNWRAGRKGQKVVEVG